MKEYNFKINGNDYTVGIEILNDTEADVIVNGASYSVEVLDTTVKPSVAAKPQVAAVPASHPVQPSTVPVTKPAAAAPAAAGESPVKSPLPGVILDIRIKEGDTVAVGQTLVVLEAMKRRTISTATVRALSSRSKSTAATPCWRATCS